MVRLNRHSLSTEQSDDLFQQLASVISPRDSVHVGAILTELLGREERIMLAKRLAAIALLVEGASPYRTARVLKLSESTVAGIAAKLAKGHYDQTLQCVARTKKGYHSFLKTLDDILHLGGVLPHYNGLDRYRYFRT